jgi:hypothetical protein
MEESAAGSSRSALDRSEDEIALQGCCSPKKTPYRFLGLALMCLLGFGTNIRESGRSIVYATALPLVFHLSRCRNDIVKREIAIVKRNHYYHIYHYYHTICRKNDDLNFVKLICLGFICLMRIMLGIKL